MSFTYFNRNIPDEAHQKIGSMGPSGISVFAFAPNGGWVIVANNGGYFARGIPDECFDQLGTFIKAGDKIRVIAFTPGGGFVIVTSRTYFARNIPEECYEKLGAMFNSGAIITCIAFPAANSWVILAGKSLYARNINDECYQYLCNCLPGSRPAKKVAFTPTGGWAILAEDYYWTRNIPDECFKEMGNIRKAGYYLDHLAFSPQGGWSIISNTMKPAGRADDPIRKIEDHIVKEHTEWQGIRARMTKYKVPGISVAVVIDNKIAWACNYGKLEKGKEEYVYVDTVFQAASVSKPVAAIGFWHLVQDGHITANENINTHLDWTLPVCSNAQSSWKSKVTLRRLLQHRGGVSGLGAPGNGCSNYGGFGGYANVAGVQVPNLTQILNGTSPSNSGAIQLTYEPGAYTDGFYSGPSYVLLTKLLEDIKGQNFRTWMKQHVLQPTGMTKSTYEMVLPAELSRAAAGHLANGSVIDGKRNRYPEAAAAGLYTTSSDLCKFIIMLNQKGKSGNTKVLGADEAETMVNDHTGIFTGGGAVNAASFHFWHNGGNAGFKSVFKGYPNRKAGVAILTNSDAGDTLYGEILKAIVDHYGWEK